MSLLEKLKNAIAMKLEDFLGENTTCKEGHDCSSGCQKDFDCPCQSTHCCERSVDKCGETDSCEYCASQVPDMADLVNDSLNER